MAGIYIHIPFCSQACHYCDFHFSTNQALVSEVTNAICQEIGLQKNYLSGNKIETIYFGGGTPSIQHHSGIEKILLAIKSFLQSETTPK